MTHVPEGSSKFPINPVKFGIIIGIGVIALWLLNWCLVILYPSTRGTIGDVFGVTNSLFSGLAFVGVAVAILLQREELDRTKTALDRQDKQVYQQNYEGFLFRLIEMLRGITDDIQATINSVPQKGKIAIDFIADRDLRSRLAKTHPGAALPEFEPAYREFFSQYKVQLANYFRLVFYIFKSIKEAEISDDKKQYYAKLVRSLLSDQEITLLFFNGLSSHGSDMKPLIEEYALLNNLSLRQIDDTYLYMYSENSYSGNAEYAAKHPWKPVDNPQ